MIWGPGGPGHSSSVNEGSRRWRGETHTAGVSAGTPGASRTPGGRRTDAAWRDSLACLPPRMDGGLLSLDEARHEKGDGCSAPARRSRHSKTNRVGPVKMLFFEVAAGFEPASRALQAPA